MAYNGSGVFTLYSPGNPVVTGTVISSTWANNTLSDIATGLSTAVCKDGQQTITANIPMAGFKFTGLGAGSAATDSVRLSQLQNGSGVTLGTIAGTNTITAVGSPVISAYAANQYFRFIPANTNSGATTINIDGVGAKNIFCGGAACVGGEIRASVPVDIFYDGTQFNIIGPYVGGNLPTGQIKFPATQNASSDANTLDDYEEGTWTPIIVSAGGGAGTYTSQTATYTKIGREVHVAYDIVLSSKAGFSAGAASVGGLPFTVLNSDGALSTAPVTWISTTASFYSITAQCSKNTTNATLKCTAAAVTSIQSVSIADLSNTTELTGSMVYNATA